MNRRTGQVYTPASTKEYESKIRQAFLKQGGESFGDAPVMIEIEALYPMPKSWSKKDRAALDGTFCDRLPDIDNLAKVVLDSIQGCATAINNDKSVAVLVAQKRWTSGEGGVEITITDVSDTLSN